MDTKRFSYEGVACAVAGVLGIIGVLTAWWQVGDVTFDGTNVTSGMWAFSLAIATFAFGVAYVVMSDRAVRRIASILMAVSATLMVAAAIAGIAAAPEGAEPGMGLWLTLVAGVIGMIGGYLGVRAAQAAPDPAANEDVVAAG